MEDALDVNIEGDQSPPSPQNPHLSSEQRGFTERNACQLMYQSVHHFVPIPLNVEIEYK